MKTRNSLITWPVLITASLGVVLCLITYTFDFIPFSFYFDAVIYRIVLSSIIVLLIFRLGLSGALRFTFGSFWRGLLCSALFLIFSLWVLILNLIASEVFFSIEVLDFICRMLMIGIMEELIFRGALLNVMKINAAQTVGGLSMAVLFSSLIFGLAHFLNLLYSPLSEVSIQVYNAFCMGILFSAIYIRCQNIWLCAFLHALWDFANMVAFTIFSVEQETVQAAQDITAGQALLSLVEPTIFLIIGVFLLRKIRKPEHLKEALEI